MYDTCTNHDTDTKICKQRKDCRTQKWCINICKKIITRMRFHYKHEIVQKYMQHEDDKCII